MTLMAFTCIKCGAAVYKPEEKCPGCGAGRTSHEQWHAYYTFLAIGAVVILGSPFGAWCVRAITGHSAQPSKTISSSQGLTALVVALMTVTLIIAIAAMIRAEKWMRQRKSREPQ